MPHAAREMTVGWKSYRYMRNNPDLRSGIAAMEARIGATPLYYIPKSKVAAHRTAAAQRRRHRCLRLDSGRIGTAHVGLAYRTKDGVLHFMHASSPRNYGKVVLDQQLSGYLDKFRSHAGHPRGASVEVGRRRVPTHSGEPRGQVEKPWTSQRRCITFRSPFSGPWRETGPSIQLLPHDS